MTSLMFEIDGKPVPADEASWYCYAPCGCCSGVTLTVRREDDVLATVEQAWRDFEPNAAQRKRDRAAGFTLRLDLRSKVKELLVMDCPHDPKWGREVTPIPAGHKWAVATQLNPANARKHLVPIEHTVDTPKVGEKHPEWTGVSHQSLCGRDEYRWWGDKNSVWLTPECVKCQRAAKKAVA